MTGDATVTFDGYNWIATLVDHPGAVTQAPTRRLLDARIAELRRLYEAT